MTNEMGLREARAELGNLANRAHLVGEITYLTRNGEQIAAIVPLDRIKEPAVIATDITATIERPTDEFASDWNWAEAATDAWLAAAEAAGLDVASWSTDVRHPDSEAAVVTVNTGARRRDEVPGAIVISDVTAEYALEVHGDDVRATPANED